MPLGQSVLVRTFVKGALASMGVDPITQSFVSRGVGWVTAHVTLDHHSQLVAELGDTAHDLSNAGDAARIAKFFNDCGAETLAEKVMIGEAKDIVDLDDDGYVIDTIPDVISAVWNDLTS